MDYPFHEALKMEIVVMQTFDSQLPTNSAKEAIRACKEALAQSAKKPVACPYPCGWNNLYSIIINKSAYLVRSTIGEDEIFTSNQRDEMVQIIEYAKTLCEWGKNTNPAPSWQGLSDDELLQCMGNGAIRLPIGWQQVARAIEQALKEKNT